MMRRRLEQFDARVRASMARHAMAAVVIAPVMDDLRDLLGGLVQEIEELRAQIQNHEEEKHG